MKTVVVFLFVLFVAIGGIGTTAASAQTQKFDPNNVEHIRMLPKDHVEGVMALYHIAENVGNQRGTIGNFREFEVQFEMGHEGSVKNTDSLYRKATAEMRTLGIKPLTFSSKGILFGASNTATDCEILKQGQQVGEIINRLFTKQNKLVLEYALGVKDGNNYFLCE